MDSLMTAAVDPFQGPQGAENTLKLAAVLAPRINFGSRPLQPGEGEGLRHLFGSLGQFAEQRRRRNAEGQVLTGLQSAFEGTTPFSALPVSDLPEATQRMILEEVGRQAGKRNLSPSDRIALLNAMGTINERGGDPMAALSLLGLSPSVFGGTPAVQPSASLPMPPQPQRPIDTTQEAPLAPSPFGPSEITRKWQSPPSSEGELIARRLSSVPTDQMLTTLQQQKENPATLAQSLNDAHRRVQDEQTRLFGGVNSQGERIPGPQTVPLSDMMNLVQLAQQAQDTEDRLAQMQGRRPTMLYPGLLPDDATLAQIDRDKSLRTNRNITLREALKEYAKILIERRKHETDIDTQPIPPKP